MPCQSCRDWLQGSRWGWLDGSRQRHLHSIKDALGQPRGNWVCQPRLIVPSSHLLRKRSAMGRVIMCLEEGLDLLSRQLCSVWLEGGGCLSGFLVTWHACQEKEAPGLSWLRLLWSVCPLRCLFPSSTQMQTCRPVCGPGNSLCWLDPESGASLALEGLLVSLQCCNIMNVQRS
jgi:hypothetical protein